MYLVSGRTDLRRGIVQDANFVLSLRHTTGNRAASHFRAAIFPRRDAHFSNIPRTRLDPGRNDSVENKSRPGGIGCTMTKRERRTLRGRRFCKGEPTVSALADAFNVATWRRCDVHLKIDRKREKIATIRTYQEKMRTKFITLFCAVSPPPITRLINVINQKHALFSLISSSHSSISGEIRSIFFNSRLVERIVTLNAYIEEGYLPLTGVPCAQKGMSEMTSE